MAMRLLSKNEITKAQTSDKTREISEGLKISRRVDALRELQAKESEALEKFRKETLESVNKDIGELSRKRDEIFSEITSLKRDIAKETSLSKEERQNLERLKIKLENQEEEINKRKEELDLAEIDIAITIKNAKDSSLRARTHEERVENLHKLAQENEDKSKSILQDAKKIEERTIKFKDETESEILIKQQVVSSKEKELKIKEDSIVEKERELAQEKIQLADQRATLERALERIRKNRLA